MTSMNPILFDHHRSIVGLVALLLVLSGMPVEPTYAAPASRAPAKPNGIIRTRVETAKLRRKGINAERSKLKRARKQGNDLVDIARGQRQAAAAAGNPFSIPPGFAKKANQLMRDHANAKRTLTRLKKQSLTDYAAEKNIRMLPKPPVGAPPVLPQTLQPPGPTRAQLKREAKSIRPGNGTVKWKPAS